MQAISTIRFTLILGHVLYMLIIENATETVYCRTIIKA